MKKRMMTLLTAFALAAAFSAAGLAATTGRDITVYPGVSVFINGKKLVPTDVNGDPVEVFIYNGTTYLPARAVSGALKLSVQWDGETNSVYIGDPGSAQSAGSVQEFYDAVTASYYMLLAVDSDLYENWRNATCGAFDYDINEAIAAVQEQHAEDVSTLIELDGKIVELYKSARETKQAETVKAVMTAYSDYYDFVINLNGSFNQYEANQPAKQKAVSSALRELLYEL